MFTDSTFMKTNYLLQKGMDVSLLRHQVIADNIANVDTPFFKRSEVTFESQMQRALNSEKTETFPAFLTDGNHMEFFKPIDYRKVEPKIHVEYDTNYRNDKNNVDIEKESSDAVENTLLYKALVQKVSKNFRMLTLSIQG